ncbi:MAG: aspartate aminotransferase family protein [Alphaproteobacteria bacterium]
MSAEARPILELNAFDPARDGGADGLVGRRVKNFGATSVLFYRKPIEMVRAEGAWMYAADGRRYLDVYNNVPSVGHCHPKVVEAICSQVARLNIHSRYLSETVETYVERLTATLPASITNLVMVCTGSEANDLAMRVAAKASGGTGFVVTESAYHGNTTAVMDISPPALVQGEPAAYVRTVPPPGPEFYGADVASGFAAAVRDAFADLAAHGFPAAGFICDTIFSSDGIYADPAGFLAPAVEVARAAGALFIADEVQPGFGRTGDALWGFVRHGVEPDIVTMGKPMGNGFPMAGMATRPAHLAAFARYEGYFNTFGANPVAAAAGLAVLDAIAEDGLQENAARVGRHLRERLADLQDRCAQISAVRGAGLFIGVELSHEGDIARPDPETAVAAINGLRERGILIGAAGRLGNTLKVRPPLCLSIEQADMVADALADVLAA